MIDCRSRDHVQIDRRRTLLRTCISINIGCRMTTLAIHENQNFIRVQTTHPDRGRECARITSHGVDCNGRIGTNDGVRQVHLAGTPQRCRGQNTDRARGIPCPAIKRMRSRHDHLFVAVAINRMRATRRYSSLTNGCFLPGGFDRSLRGCRGLGRFVHGSRGLMCWMQNRNDSGSEKK